MGFIKQIATEISEEFKLNIRSFNLEAIEGLIDVKITFFINNTGKLTKLMQHMKKTDGVIKVTRMNRFD
jgi:GTP pyrophosphokinase